MSAQTEKDPTTQPDEPSKAERLTAIEVLDSLSGFDEIAIRQRFGASVEDLWNRSPGRELARALAFVLHRRDGRTDAEAYDAAMGATLPAVNDMFADFEDDEIDPEEPETETGKDGSAPGKRPRTSRPSSSSE